MKKLFLTIGLSAVLSGSYAQVSEFNPGIVADGVNYALPRTGVVLDVIAQKVVYTPGEFARFAERYLHVLNVSAEAATEWKLTNLDVSQCAEADPAKYYTVKMKDKTIAPMVQLTDDGVIASINTSTDIPAAREYTTRSTNNVLDPKKYMTADILAATSTAKMAELTAQEILDIRDSKNAIKRGQVESMPKDGESLKIVLEELDLQERSLMQLFVGYRDTVTVHESYTIIPNEDVADEVVFRFSRKLGFVDVDDLSGEPYRISIKNRNSVPTPTELERKKRKITGIVYNMPSNATVTVTAYGKSVFEKDLPFGQFGTVDVLNNALFGKDSTVKVTFNPITGGLVHIEN